MWPGAGGAGPATREAADEVEAGGVHAGDAGGEGGDGAGVKAKYVFGGGVEGEAGQHHVDEGVAFGDGALVGLDVEFLAGGRGGWVGADGVVEAKAGVAVDGDVWAGGGKEDAAGAAGVLYLLGGGEFEAGAEGLEGGPGVGDAGAAESGVGGAGVGEVGEGGVVGGAAATAGGQGALDGEDDGVGVGGGVEEEDGALAAGDDVVGGDGGGDAEGGEEGGVGSHELHVGLVGAGGVGLDDGLGDDAAAWDALGVVAEALGHGAPSSIWWS